MFDHLNNTREAAIKALADQLGISPLQAETLTMRVNTVNRACASVHRAMMRAEEVIARVEREARENDGMIVRAIRR